MFVIHPTAKTSRPKINVAVNVIADGVTVIQEDQSLPLVSVSMQPLHAHPIQEIDTGHRFVRCSYGRAFSPFVQRSTGTFIHLNSDNDNDENNNYSSNHNYWKKEALQDFLRLLNGCNSLVRWLMLFRSDFKGSFHDQASSMCLTTGKTFVCTFIYRNIEWSSFQLVTPDPICCN